MYPSDLQKAGNDFCFTRFQQFLFEVKYGKIYDRHLVRKRKSKQCTCTHVRNTICQVTYHITCTQSFLKYFGMELNKSTKLTYIFSLLSYRRSRNKRFKLETTFNGHWALVYHPTQPHTRGHKSISQPGSISIHRIF